MCVCVMCVSVRHNFIVKLQSQATLTTQRQGQLNSGVTVDYSTVIFCKMCDKKRNKNLIKSTFCRVKLFPTCAGTCVQMKVKRDLESTWTYPTVHFGHLTKKCLSKTKTKPLPLLDTVANSNAIIQCKRSSPQCS